MSAPSTQRMATFGEISAKGKLAMFLLALQFGLTPFIAGWVHRSSKAQFHSFAGIALTEMLKILLALGFVFLEQGGMLGVRSVWGQWRITESLSTALVPALLFGAQDLLIDYANRPQNKCAPMLFLLFNQTKILWGAIFLWLTLKVRRSKAQWVALWLMFVGSVFLSIDSTKSNLSGAFSLETLWDQPIWGTAAALGSAVISGFNQMLSEYITRIKPLRRPEMLFATELAVYKIVLMGALYALSEGSSGSFWTGVELRTFALLGMSAGGGICVALVNSQAGGDWKGYSLLAGLCLSTSLELYLLEVSFSPLRVFSVFIIIVSVYVYNRFPPKVKPE